MSFAYFRPEEFPQLARKIVHFELGGIEESERELLAVAGFLITNDVRNYLMTMRRGARKRLILEELSAFLALENGPKIERPAVCVYRVALA